MSSRIIDTTPSEHPDFGWKAVCEIRRTDSLRLFSSVDDMVLTLDLAPFEGFLGSVYVETLSILGKTWSQPARFWLRKRPCFMRFRLGVAV
jgi:hypothetical protein